MSPQFQMILSPSWLLRHLSPMSSFVPSWPVYLMSPTYSIFHLVPLSDLNWEADGREPVGKFVAGLVFDDGAEDGTGVYEFEVVAAGGPGARAELVIMAAE